VCGICGWIGNEPSETPRHIDLMVSALKKRGPDGNGVWNENGELCFLGHTRLSIIDVEGSPQPMTNEDGTVILIYNGEMYNYQKLRAMLIDRGHQFRTVGDTEVLVHLYEEYGPGMVDHLDGMFAFGIYDTRKHSLLLARDRIGIKPLYYWHNPATGELLFASDMSAMLANPAVPRKLNLKALAQYLHFGYIVHPLTWLQGVHQLEPGQIAVWTEGKLKTSRYYDWKYEPDAQLANMAAAVSELRRTLSDSVASHLIADVPLGSFLSGGLDSSTITGFAQQTRRKTRQGISSFNVRFWVPELDESARAKAIAGDLGTQHEEIDAEETPFDRCFMERLVDGLGEPFGDTSALAVYVLCQQSRPHVKVALSGDGGDEIFLGYKGLLKQRLARRLRVAPKLVRRVAVKLAANKPAELPRRLNKYLGLSLLKDEDLIIEWCRRCEKGELQALLGAKLFKQLFPCEKEPFPEVRAMIGPGKTGGFLEQQIRFHMLVDLPCDMLFKVDRMSMAHGLEVRVPMLANDMLEYAGRLPLEMRLQNKRTKEPLRTLAETLSPTLAQPSPKRGFGFPLDEWMRGKIVQYWQDWGITSILEKVGLQRTEIERMLASYGQVDPLERTYDTESLSGRLFDLLVLAIWLDKYQVQV
jgi:asparagine synthase (glutamine-hydrolysing)